jgi:phage protein U
MQFALLGDVQFELITYFDGLDGKFGADYAEHARIEGKPRLQWMGDKLDEWSLTLKFHQAYCDPEVELVKLRTAMDGHVALPFVLASGDYKGKFVITDISITSEQTDTRGVLVAVGVALTLREMIDPLNSAKPDAPGVRKAGKSLHPMAKYGQMDQAKPTGLAGSLREAVNAARDMVGAIKSVAGLVAIAKSFKNNPAAAVEQLRNGIPGFEHVVKAADRVGINLTPLQSTTNDAGPVLAAAGSVATEAHSASSLLGDVNEQNLSSRLDAVNACLGKMGREADSSSAPMARLSAKSAVRAEI